MAPLVVKAFRPYFEVLNLIIVIEREPVISKLVRVKYTHEIGLGMIDSVKVNALQ